LWLLIRQIGMSLSDYLRQFPEMIQVKQNAVQQDRKYLS
jgi:hypothetical protein